VQLDLGAGTATDAVDYDAFEQAVIDAAALESGVSYNSTTNVLTFDSDFDGQFDFTVDAIDDSLVEGTETIIADLSNATVSNGTASITTPSTTTNITENDAAVTFAVNVSSEDAANDSSTQSATIAEEVLSDNQGTFTIVKGGDALTGSNTATVTITVSGSAEGDDFVGMSGTGYADVVAAIKAAAEAAGLTVANDDSDSLEVTWAAGDTLSFDVDLTAFDDDILDPESLTLTLSGASVDDGSATLASGEESATLNITDVDAEPTAGAVSALVDDDGLSGGIPGGVGDDTPDTDPDNDESTYSGTLTFDFGDNGAGSIDLAEMHGETGSLGIENIAYSWDGGTDTLTASITSGDRSGTDLFTVSVNPTTGAYTVTLLNNVLHDSLDGVAGDDTENNDSVSLTYTVRDSDTDTADGTLTINFDDDTPAAYDPMAGLVKNDGSSVIVESLNSLGAIGADNFAGDTNVEFNTTQEGDSGLISGGNPVYYWVDGNTLTASTSDTEGGVNGANTIFTVVINNVEDTYTLTMFDTLDNGSGVSFADLSGTGEAGNPSFKIVESSDPASDLELLFTPVGNATSVNSDSDDVAVDSQFIVDGDGLRVDFGQFNNDDMDNFPNIDQKTNINGFKLSIDQIAGGTTATLLLIAYDADGYISDPLEIDPITQVDVFDDGGTLVASWDGTGTNVTINGITFSSLTDGEATVSGVGEGWSIATHTLDGYSALELYNDETLGTDGKFSFSNLEVLSTDAGAPLYQSFDTILTDADGDTSAGSIDVTFAPASTITGTSGDDLNLDGTTGNDIIFGGAGNDIITGGLGDDTLSGGGGADEFVWIDGDSGTDVVIDFNAGEGDVLNLADLLDPDTTLDIGGADNLNDYMTATYDGVSDTTTINVYTDGSAQGAENLTQTIVVNGDQTDLTALIDNNNLNVDQS
jgi:hypothetical protein